MNLIYMREGSMLKKLKYIIVLSIVLATMQASLVVSAHYEIEEFEIVESGCTLFVDLDILTMTAYLDGKVYKTYPVSGGAENTPSPVGMWHVIEISNWGEGFGGSWIGLDVPWGKYGIHGTVKPWLIGKQNASHGCIRMIDKDVNEIKQLVAHGSIVYIKHDSLPFRNMGKDTAGSDVYRTQIMLKNLGFYTGTIDGIFGEGMERAVKSFQRTYQLLDNGIVERKTYEKIVEQNDIKTSTYKTRQGT